MKVVRTSGRWLLAASLAVAPATATAQAIPRTGAPAVASTGASEIGLAVGEQYSIPATGIRSYSVGTDGIVDVRVPTDGSRLLLVGQRQGSTSLLVIRADGTQQTYAVTVFRIPLEIARQQLTQLLSAYNGVTINQIGGRLFLEGGVGTEAQQRRVQQISQIYLGQVESLVSIDPTIVERRINVRVDLYFVELSRNSNFAFGLAWPGSFGGGSITAQPQLTYTVPGMGMPNNTAFVLQTNGLNISQALPRIDILQNSGWARVHRQATLITGNGVEAKYAAGGEFNILPSAALGNNAAAVGQIQTIKFGTDITVTPRFDPTTNRVDMRITAALSDLQDTGANVPGRSLSEVGTTVNLQLGQSIMLSGLRARNSGAGATGLPFLSQIPVLGALFGAQSRRDSDRELVIFVVPSVIEGVSRQAEDRIANALRAYEEFGGWIPDNSRLRSAPAAPAGITPGTEPAR